MYIVYLCLFFYLCCCCCSVVSRLFANPWTIAHQASNFTISQSLLKLMPIELVMPSNHLILCCPLLLLPSTFNLPNHIWSEFVINIYNFSYGCYFILTTSCLLNGTFKPFKSNGINNIWRHKSPFLFFFCYLSFLFLCLLLPASPWVTWTFFLEIWFISCVFLVCFFI